MSRSPGFSASRVFRPEEYCRGTERPRDRGIHACLEPAAGQRGRAIRSPPPALPEKPGGQDSREQSCQPPARGGDMVQPGQNLTGVLGDRVDCNAPDSNPQGRAHGAREQELPPGHLQASSDQRGQLSQAVDKACQDDDNCATARNERLQLIESPRGDPAPQKECAASCSSDPVTDAASPQRARESERNHGVDVKIALRCEHRCSNQQRLPR